MSNVVGLVTEAVGILSLYMLKKALDFLCVI
jgi:hypothetical protein